MLIVTAWLSDTEAKRLLRQGVAGILSKESPLEALAESTRLIHGGAICLDNRYRNLTAAETAEQTGAGPRFNERQRKVLRFVLEGLSNKVIAAQLHISVHTVSSHLDRIRDKTRCRRRADLTRLALKEHLI